MTQDPRSRMVRQALARYHAGRISRRQLVGLLGALGLSAAAAPWLIDRGAGAKTAVRAGHAGHMMPLAQEGTPPPAATPQLGQQPDGTTRYKVIAGGFGEETEGIELTAFYPGEITINAGDSIYWEIRGFHNVHFLSGAPLPPDIISAGPATGVMAGGTPVAGVASPTAGPPRLALNPEVVFPTGGPTYDGTGVVNSGVPLDPTAPPFVLTFTTAGEYVYYCTIHGEVMEGRVVVQETGAAAPMDQAAIDQLAMEEMTADLEAARAAIAQAGGLASPMAGGTMHQVIVGLSGDPYEIDRFFPPQLTIRAGDTVRFTNPTTEPPIPHTVTFVSGGAAPEFVVPEPSDAGPPLLLINPELVAPAGGGTYSGQGYFNSGLLRAGVTATTYDLTFDTAGTYRYYCAVHGDPESGMIGDIVVEAAG